MVKVFVSSVSKGLEDTRRQLFDALRVGNYQLVNMEAFGARPSPPLDVCLSELRTADAVIVIIGPRYGSLISTGDVSFTHEEFREAKRHGIPVLVVRIPSDANVDKAEEQKIKAFTDEAAKEVTYALVTPDRLSAIVLASLTSARDRGELGHRFLLFQKWDLFFAHFLPSATCKAPLFNHSGPFVGRESELGKLQDFIAGDSPLFVLQAAGGTGKSRLLLEMAKKVALDKKDLSVLFVDPGAEWSADHITTLPSSPVLLIFDDAHRRADLDRLIDACRRQNKGARFLVSFRPGALAIVKPHLANLATQEFNEVTLDLQLLTKGDALKLAGVCLGAEFAHLAERLIELSGGNPLIISVGAKCIAIKQVLPEVLDHTPEEFRRVVLDSLLRDPCFDGSDGSLRRRLLELVAAVGPVNSEDSNLIERFASFVGAQIFEVRQAVAILENSEFMQRRGRFLRVSPDILGDHLLYRAAISERGEVTGFVEAVVKVFSPTLLGNILANGAELDWRAAVTSAHPPVLTETWKRLGESLPQATNRRRAELLGQLRRPAVFAPKEVLELAEWLCEHPDAPADSQIKAFGFEEDSTEVNEAIAGMLAFIATHPDYTDRCLRSLWPFAISQEGPTHSNPSHPRRRIEELLKYNGRVLPLVQLATLGLLFVDLFVTGWLNVAPPPLLPRATGRPAPVAPPPRACRAGRSSTCPQRSNGRPGKRPHAQDQR
jgi:hypothetical protein